MNTVNVLEKRLSWTYNHCRNGNRTILDGSLALDSANKVSGTYELGSANRKIKYSYVHGGVTTLEPSYDFGRNSWDLALSHRFDNDVIRASYDAASKNLGVEWSCKSSLNSEGRVKVCGCFDFIDLELVVWTRFVSSGRLFSATDFSFFQFGRGSRHT